MLKILLLLLELAIHATPKFYEYVCMTFPISSEIQSCTINKKRIQPSILSKAGESGHVIISHFTISIPLLHLPAP
uniref:Secreted protein n=1 Tax=Rhizophora mucronata TaxID=61149 RepID=A0A2P2ITD0_RHIMU